MLVRMWKKLLCIAGGLAVHYGETAWWFLKKNLWPSNSTASYPPTENENTRMEDIYTPMFTVALFILAKIWKESTCLLIDKWIEKIWCTQRNVKRKWKKWNFSICINMNEPRACYIKWNQSKDKYCMISLTCET